MVEEICQKFLSIVIPEYDQRNTLQAVRKIGTAYSWSNKYGNF